MGYTSVRKCILIEIRTKFNLIHEKEWTGDTISNICRRYDVSRKTYYKWKNRYEKKGIVGLSDTSRRPHNIKHKKVTPEVEETIIEHLMVLLLEHLELSVSTSLVLLWTW